MFTTVFWNVLYVGAWASLAFIALLVIVDRLGLFRHVRHEDGSFKHPTIKSIAIMLPVLILILSMLYWGNVRLISQLGVVPDSSALFWNGFGIFFFVHLFDLLVIDYLIIVRWHPPWLDLPETDYYRSFRPHLIGFIRGIPLGIVLSLIAMLIIR